MRRLICSLIVLQGAFMPLSSVFSGSIATTPDEVVDLKDREVLIIDEQILSLTNLRDYYADKAARLRARGDRYNIRGGKDHQEMAKALLTEADEYNRIVEHLDKELESLEKQREVLVSKG